MIVETAKHTTSVTPYLIWGQHRVIRNPDHQRLVPWIACQVRNDAGLTLKQFIKVNPINAQQVDLTKKAALKQPFEIKRYGLPLIFSRSKQTFLAGEKGCQIFNIFIAKSSCKAFHNGIITISISIIS